jgi:hypothetical protein
MALRMNEPSVHSFSSSYMVATSFRTLLVPPSELALHGHHTTWKNVLYLCSTFQVKQQVKILAITDVSSSVLEVYSSKSPNISNYYHFKEDAHHNTLQGT